MIDVTGGWVHGLERGPGWLFIRLCEAPRSAGNECSLADAVWSLVEQHFVYRIVLECDDVPRLTAAQIDQLALLRERVNAHGGIVRLSGLSRASVAAIEHRGLSRALPDYDSREDAVMANRPKQPR